MPVTLKDIASRLGLSITTVSRALAGYADVSPATRERVRGAAAEMGYVPNATARQLRKRRADAIGYALPASQVGFADPYFSEFIAGLGDEARLHGLDLLVSSAPPGEAAEQALYQRWARGRRVDGIVLNRMRLNDWRVQYLHDSGFPFVASGHSVMPIDFPHIEVDARSGFATLVGHLAARGHRRIAYVGAAPDLTLQVDRFAGYRDGLEAAGLAFDAELVDEGNLTHLAGYQAAQRLLALPQPPTAITCVNDLSAIGVLRAAHERGLVVGRELAVAGFDGVAQSENTQPPLTTLNQPVYDIARQLVQMLVTVINGGTLAKRHVLLQPQLIVRASTG